ncbi:MAG: tetratricopeptide repeat protein, partial [Acidobacteria bacterium]
MRLRTGCLILIAWLFTGLSMAQSSSAYQRGVQLYNQAKYSEALDAFSQAISDNPKDSNAYRQRARCRQRLEDLQGALADFDKAIELDARNVRALTDRSAVKRRLKDVSGALDDINRAIEADPRNANSYSVRGLLRWDAKDYKGALDDYDYSVSLDPKQSAVLNNRGLVKEKLNDFDGALADYTKAIENNPKNADAYSNRAFCRKQMGDAQAARLDYESALAIEPAHKFATAQLKKLDAEGLGAPKRVVVQPPQKTAIPDTKSVAKPIPPKSSGPTTSMTFGDFNLQVPAGWERAPSEVEKQDKTWQIADVKGLKEADDPLILAFPFENVPFTSEQKRLEYLSVYRNNVRKSHAQSFSSEKVTLAGVDFERLRFKDKDGRTTFYLTPYNGAKVYHIYVFRPDGQDAFPERASELLSSLRLSGPEYRDPSLPTDFTSKTKPVTAPTTSDQSPAVPTVHFQASDPCQGAKTTMGLPWQTAKVNGPSTPPPGIPAATLAPFLDFNKLSAVQYNGAVSVAMEGMRLLYGEMSAEDEQKFQAAWAPLFDYPTPAMVDYLNKLNPLLGQFLAGREAFMRTAAAVNAAMYDAALGVAADTRDAYVDALARADRQGQVLRSLEAGLIQVAGQIQRLGNPPNPLAAKCEAQRRHQRTLEKPAAAPQPGSASFWSGTFECTSCATCNAAG